MDFKEVTAFCGVDCWNCQMFHSNQTEETKEYYSKLLNKTKEEITCLGCRIQGGCPVMNNTCKTRECVTAKGLDFCYECDEFPCNCLNPSADRADKLPQNFKVFNLCTIRREGLQEWAENHASEIRKRYYEGKVTLGSGPQL